MLVIFITLNYFVNTTDAEESQKQIQPYSELELPARETFELLNQTNAEYRSLHQAQLSTEDENLTPVLDMDRLSTVLQRIEMGNSTEHELLADPPTDYNNPVSRYIAKVINCGHEANIARVSFKATRAEGSNFKVYARCSTSDDESIQDKPWVEMVSETTNESMPTETENWFNQKFYYQKPVGFTEFQTKVTLTGNPLKTKYAKISEYKSYALYDPAIDETVDGVGEVYAEGQYTAEEAGDEG